MVSVISKPISFSKSTRQIPQKYTLHNMLEMLGLQPSLVVV